MKLILLGEKDDQKEEIGTFEVNEEKLRKLLGDISFTIRDDDWFGVYPSQIEQKNFKNKRNIPAEEELRVQIDDAFQKLAEMQELRDFEVFIPEKYWDGFKTCGELEELAEQLGDFMVDELLDPIYMAQQIHNAGYTDEIWNKLCKQKDTAEWYRLIKLLSGWYRLEGGSSKLDTNLPPSAVDDNYYSGSKLVNAVPLVGRWKK